MAERPLKTIVGCFPSCPAQWGDFITEKNSDDQFVIQGGHIVACPNTYPNCIYCRQPGHFMDECLKLPKETHG